MNETNASESEFAWKETSLAEIGRIVSGGTPSTSNPENWNGPIAWITPADLSGLRGRHLLTTERTLTELGLANSSAHLLPPRSLVVSSRAPIGHMALPLVSFCTNQGCKSIEFFDEQDPDFHYYNLRFWVRRLHDKGEGTTFSEISKKALEAVQVPVPANPKVQEAIAAVLALLDQGIDQTEALLFKQKRIKTGLIYDLLTRGLDDQGCVRDDLRHEFKTTSIGLVPSDWEVVPIESLVPPGSPICYGIVQVGPHTPGGVPTIAIRDLGDIQVLKLHHTEREREKSFARSRCQAGDLLISIKATTGKIGVAPSGFNGNISRDLARVRLLPSEVPNFFKYQLQAAAGQSRLDAITVGTTRKELSIIPLRSLLVARPKPNEQQAIASKIQRLEADLARLECLIGKQRLLKNGLMQDLLTGLVPVTPLVSTTVS